MYSSVNNNSVSTLKSCCPFNLNFGLIYVYTGYLAESYLNRSRFLYFVQLLIDKLFCLILISIQHFVMFIRFIVQANVNVILFFLVIKCIFTAFTCIDSFNVQKVLVFVLLCYSKALLIRVLSFYP